MCRRLNDGHGNLAVTVPRIQGWARDCSLTERLPPNCEAVTCFAKRRNVKKGRIRFGRITTDEHGPRVVIFLEASRLNCPYEPIAPASGRSAVEFFIKAIADMRFLEDRAKAQARLAARRRKDRPKPPRMRSARALCGVT